MSSRQSPVLTVLWNDPITLSLILILHRDEGSVVTHFGPQFDTEDPNQSRTADTRDSKDFENAMIQKCLEPANEGPFVASVDSLAR